MNELTSQSPHTDTTILRRAFGYREERQSGVFYGYSLLLIALGVGWLARDDGLVNPKFGLGYWLGIIGSTMMLLLLLYPYRKRIKAFQAVGTTSQWFRAHWILGLIGPLLVLYHCNFQLGSFNSKVALFSMLLVAGSGVFGLHFYARVHSGLHGRKTSLGELRGDLAESLDSSHGLATLLPNLIAELERLSAEVQGDSITKSLGIGASLMWTFRKYLVWHSLSRIAHRELQDRAAESATVARDFRRLKKVTSKYIRNYVHLMGRVAQFTFYEKMFSVWHVLHLPLFYMLVFSALLHVLAVHMY